MNNIIFYTTSKLLYEKSRDFVWENVLLHGFVPFQKDIFTGKKSRTYGWQP